MFSKVSSVFVCLVLLFLRKKKYNKRQKQPKNICLLINLYLSREVTLIALNQYKITDFTHQYAWYPWKFHCSLGSSYGEEKIKTKYL